LKRLLEILVSGGVLLALLPVFAVISFVIWGYDRGSPFYVANRVGRGGHLFKMMKFRTMIVDADRTGVTSTAGNDTRVTPIGRVIRRFKLDELVQFVNVFVGDMSVVGPRPNVPAGTASYTRAEMRLLTVKPGITDFASIVFADEAEILRGHEDPDLAYDELIRPWKSRLGLFYIDNRSGRLDAKLVILTAVAIVSRSYALAKVTSTLDALGAPPDLVAVCSRSVPLQPAKPPDLDDFAVES